MQGIIDYFKSAIDWVLLQIQIFFLWIYDGILYIFIEMLIAPILHVIASIIEAIPLPSWYTYGSTNLGVAAWMADLMSVDVGIGIVLGAYTIRFFIRRIPVIG